MRYYQIILIITFFPFCLHAQDLESTKNIFVPDIDGIVKTKYEYDLKNKLSRFVVRNARFGAKGNINEVFGYRVEVDLSDEGKIKMLDAYAKFTPVKNLDFYLGQRKIPFGTDYMRSPADNLFANRSFVAKYVNDGLRDIGFTGSYKTEIAQFPVEIWAAAMNGSGNNNPQWKTQPNYGARLVLGNKENGISVKGNIYSGDTEKEVNLLMYSGEIAFNNKNFLLESEFIHRTWSDTLNADYTSNGLYFHSFYVFELKKQFIKYIMPKIRWDLMGDNILQSKNCAQRATIGVNFGFDRKLFSSEIRIDYENYLKSCLPIHTDKFTVEFVAKF